jgi:dTDP-4-amino-4,6-dideoxygalactose transaminase
MNEVQAAFGLLQLKFVDAAIIKRKELTKHYNKLLNDINGITLMHEIPGLQYNYAYYPILINEKDFGCSRDDLYEQLKKNNIFTRRYFYPLISDFPTYKALPSSDSSNLAVAVSVSKQVLCLPVYPDLAIVDIERICNHINSYKRIR